MIASITTGRKLKSLALLVLSCGALLIILSGCFTRREAPAFSPEAVVWEGWEVVNKSYVNTASLDAEAVSGDIILGMLDFAEKPAYPFLTQLDNVRRRPPAEVPDGLEDVWRAWTLVRDTWPEVDSNLLAEAALRSMMQSLDDNVSAYLTPEAYRMSQERTDTSYEGVGAVIGIEDGSLTVVSLVSGGPAERAGLQRNDVILEVNDQPVAGRSLAEAAANIKGSAGTRVSFLINRATESEPREVTVTRALLDIPTVDMSLLPSSVGYLYIKSFGENTMNEVLDALETFNQLETLGMVLDLRSNEEGPLNVARDVAAQFLPEGLFLYEIDNLQQRTDLSIDASGALNPDIRLVVLVNEGTAEAAEALAGALQDSGRGIVIGDTTRGRGFTNSYAGLSNGGALLFPVSRWHTPSGKAIIQDGIVPDILAPLSREDLLMSRDSQLARAYEYLDENLPAFR